MTVPQRLSFSAQLTNCNVGPCWQVMAHIGACWHSAFSTCHSLGRWLQWFYKVLDIKFFHLKITLGLSLGETWLLLAQPRINTDVYKGLLPWEGFPKQTCINHIPRKRGCKLMDQIWTVQQFCASLGRRFCHGNEHHGIGPSIFSSSPSWLFHKGCLSLNCCQTAILPHLGTLNSAYWAFSTFQSAFIREYVLVVLWGSFNWK